MRPRRALEAPQAARPPAPRRDATTPPRADLDDAHAALGNSAVAAHNLAPNSSTRAPSDPLGMQSRYGNGAVARAAQSGKSDTSQPSVTTPSAATTNALPAYMPAAAPDTTADTADTSLTPPEGVGAFDATASPFMTPPLYSPLYDFTPFGLPYAPLNEPYPTGPQSDAEAEEASTIVFDEETIVAGRPAEGEEEEKEEEKEQEAQEAEEAARASEEGQEFEEREAEEEAKKGAEEEKPSEDAAEEAEKTEGAQAKPEEVVKEAEEGAEEAPGEEAVEEAEAVAEEQVIEADPEGVEEGATPGAAPAAEGGAGGAGAAPELSEWKAKVSGATRTIKPPDMGDAAGAGGRVRTAGGAAAGNAAAKRQAIPKEAENVIPPPPKPPDPLPPPAEDPVPAATQRVRDASDKKLPNQTLPTLVATPGGNMPKVAGAISSAYSTKVTTESEIAKAAQAAEAGEADAKGEKDPEKEKAKKVKEAAKKKPETEKEGSGEPMVLVDEGPPPPAPITKEMQPDIGKVLAVIVSNPEPAAKEIVTDARRAAYPKGMLLEKEYDDFGDEVFPEVLTALTEQLDKIREQAGISKDELKAHVDERRKKAEEEGKKGVEDVTKAAEEEKSILEEWGQKIADAVAGARDGLDQSVEQKVEAASGDTDPTVIKKKRERLLRGVNRKVAQQSVAYQQAGTRREKSLNDLGGAIITGYTLAARQDETTIYEKLLKETKPEKDKDKEKARQDAARSQAAEQAKGSFTWLKDKLAEVNKQLGQLKTDAKTASAKLDTEVNRAGDYAKDAIREWAANLLDEHQGFWDWLMDLLSDWSAEAEEKAAAWEEARTAEARDGIVRDLEAMQLVKQLEARKIDGKLAMGMAGLTEEQRAVIKAYYEQPEGSRDSIAAVAAGLRTRISVQRRPDLISKFETKLVNLPPARWKDIDLIANVQQPGGNNAYHIASEVHGAVDQWGTDEDRIYKALANMSPLRAVAARKCYTAKGWGDMDADIADEMSGAELDRAQAQLSGDQALADAATLREAMKGGLTGIGTDEQTIMQVLRGKTEEQRKAIIEAYKREYGDDLSDDLADEMSGHDIDRADALMEGDTAKADAIAIDQAMHGGLFGLGTEEKEIEAVYAQNRAEVEAEAAAKGWTTAQMEAEVKRRNGQIESKYNQKYAVEEGGMTLREAFKDELSGPELDLAVALQDNDLLAADMARLEIEKQSLVYASDEAMNNVLKAQGERARKEVERDEKLDMQNRAEIDALRGFPWDEKRWKSERDALDERIEQKTAEKAHANMSALEQGYDAKYSKFGSGGFRYMIAMNMSGSDKKMAWDLIEQGGILRPEQEIDYAIEGAGTDEDAVKKVLAGKSPAQIQKIREAWEKKHPGKNFNDEVLSEFSGRERFDIEIMLDGEPQTPQEKLAQARKKLNYEKSGYLMAGAFSEEERAQMEDEAAALERDVKRLETLKEGTEEYERANERYQLQASYFEQSVENHRAAVDSVTDTFATIAGIVATIAVVVAAVAITVLTGGAAAPGILAALGTVMTSAGTAAAMAGAAALATIGTKYLMKGSAYGVEEMGIDLAVGAADALASFATAGLGGKLLKMGKLAALSKSGKMLPRLFANAMAEGAEGFASSLPSALTGSMLDDRNWKGDPFSNIMGSAMVGVGMGTVLSGGMGMLGGISKPASKAAGEVGEGAELLAEQAAKNPPQIETPEMLARRGTPTERVAGFESFQKANPGKSYDDFIAELDAGVLTHKADDEAVQQMNKRMRDELFTDIPPGQRDQFKDVALDVVSDAEFERLTRSASGQAVVVIENGKPRVLMRESADPKVLREEGIHLLQSADPEKAHLFRQLDESVLSKWDTLPLDEQINLYGKKLDLEIDGQQRLINNLEEALAAAGDDAAARKQILEQLEQAQETLDNLTRRLDEVGDLTPQKRLDIAAGKEAKPDFLEQPARLFAKKDRLTIKRELVAALKAKNLNTDKANAVLGKLHSASKKGKAGEAAFDALVAKVKKMPKNEADAFINQLDGVMKKLDHADAAMLEIVAASAAHAKPQEFLHTVGRIVSKGSDSAERVSGEALEQMMKKVKGLQPKAADDFITRLAEVVEGLPEKKAAPREFSGFIIAAAKQEDPGPFLDQLQKFAKTFGDDNVKMADGSLGRLGMAIGEMEPPAAAAKYLPALEALVAKHGPDLEILDGFLAASTKAKDPAGFLSVVDQLKDRQLKGGLSRESLAILSQKAAGGGVDIEWLAKTDLFTKNTDETNTLLEFLALDPQTPWNSFKKVASVGSDKKAIAHAFKTDGEFRRAVRTARKKIRGAAGELVTQKNMKDLLLAEGLTLTDVKRQLQMKGTISDFLVELATGVKRGVEVKAFGKSFWEQYRAAINKLNKMSAAAKGKFDPVKAFEKLPKKQQEALKALHHLIEEQVPASVKSTGLAPIVFVSDIIKTEKGLRFIKDVLEAELPPGTTLLFIDEKKIRAMIFDIRDLLAIRVQ